MKKMKKVFSEEDVTLLDTRDWVYLAGKPSMKSFRKDDGMNYLTPNENGTITETNLRGYQLSNGGIIPIWYSQTIIDFNHDEGGNLL